MRGRNLRLRGPKLNLSHTVNRGSRYPIHVHQPVAFDAISGFLTERQYLVQNSQGLLVDIRNRGTYDTPIPEGDG